MAKAFILALLALSSFFLVNFFVFVFSFCFNFYYLILDRQYELHQSTSNQKMRWKREVCVATITVVHMDTNLATSIAAALRSRIEEIAQMTAAEVTVTAAEVTVTAAEVTVTAAKVDEVIPARARVEKVILARARVEKVGVIPARARVEEVIPARARVEKVEVIPARVEKVDEVTREAAMVERRNTTTMADDGGESTEWLVLPQTKK